MRKTIWTLTWRSVRTSFGRWIAIFLISFLSVGFFTGLVVCKPQFWKACDNYTDAQNLYDYRLYSSLGFDDSDVEQFQQLDGVEYAEGQKSMDASVSYGGSTKVYELISMPENVNLPSVRKGRLPETAQECVVDHRAFPDSAIGQTVTVSDDTEYLENRTYTIVGIVNTPVYLNGNRGSAAIGNGKREGFIYIPSENFTVDYYSEIDITLTGSDAEEIYSASYDRLIDGHEDAVQSELTECADKHYNEILKEIQQKADAQAAESVEKLQSSVLLSGEDMNESVRDAVNLLMFPVSVEEFASEQGLSDEETEALREALGKDSIDSIEELENLTVEPMTLEQAEEAAQENGIEAPTTHLLRREDNDGYVSFCSDTSIISAIAGIFPFFFILIALLVCITTMTRMVGEERTQIGTLMATGYSRFAITMKYMLYAGFATLFGWAAGFIMGTYLIPKGFWAAYSSLYDFTSLPYVFRPELAVLTLLVSLSAIVVSIWLSCRSEFLDTPAALIRPKSAKPGSRILLERLSAIWSRLSFIRKVTLRNMFRYKLRMFMMLIGIGCCTALVVTAFGVRDSMINVGNLQYDEIQTYDLAVTFDAGYADEVTSAIRQMDDSRVRATIPCVSETVDAGLSEDGTDEGSSLHLDSVSLVSFADGADPSRFWNFTTWDGKNEVAPPSGDGVVISRRLAQKLKLSVGDTIIVEDNNGMSSGGETQTASLKVQGIFRNYIGNYIFISMDAYREYFMDTTEVTSAGVGGSTSLMDTGSDGEASEDVSGETSSGDSDPANTILIQTAGDIDDSLLESLTNIEYVTGVTNLEENRAQVNRSLDCLNYIIWLLVVFSGALEFIVIFNLTNINLAERSREIATVEVLGFYPRETRSYILWENLAIAVIAGAIGLPAGWLFCRFVIGRILIDQMTFPIHVTLISYLMSFFCTVLFALIVNLCMNGRITAIRMAESLKAVE